MKREDVNIEIIDDFEFAKENGLSEPTVALYLKDERKIEIWYDEENECYFYSDATYGYQDLEALQNDLWDTIGEIAIDAIELE